MIEKLDGLSMDIETTNKEKLRAVFPECFNDGKLDIDKLLSLCGEYISDDFEKYEFKWKGKSDCLRLAQKRSTATLRPCPEESVNFDTTQNLYIEGDNLEVLKLLQKSYYNRIKMIYIDPPYNTGHDFVYEDDFADPMRKYLEVTKQTTKSNPETMGRYHTNWLNMMYPRLRLAANLLQDDGVIFISIDDNEVHNLRKICDEVFGEENFVAILSIENNPKGRKNSKYISISNEYCLIYAKNSSESYFVENIPKNIKDLKQDSTGDYVHNSGKRVLVGENSFNKPVLNFNSAKHYTVYYNGIDLKIKKEQLINQIDETLLNAGYNRYFSYDDDHFVENTYTEQKFLDLYNQGLVDFKNDKIYERNTSTKIRLKSLLTNKEYKAIVNGNKVTFTMDFKTTSANTTLDNLFNCDDIFPKSKNISFLKILLSLLDDKNGIVLDFFSGSATTAHAIMQLNTDDGGNRKFIMVQLPEKCDEDKAAYKAGYANICEIGKERIRLAGKQILENTNLATKPDIGFKVLKLDTSNMQMWDDTPVSDDDLDRLLARLHGSINTIKPDRSDLDLIYEILLKLGYPLTSKISTRCVDDLTFYSIDDNDMFISLKYGITIEHIEKMLSYKPQKIVLAENSLPDNSVMSNAHYLLENNGVELKII